MKALYLIKQCVPETALWAKFSPSSDTSSDQNDPTSCHSDWKSRPFKQLWLSQPLNVKVTELWAGWHEFRWCPMVWDMRSCSSSRDLCSFGAQLFFTGIFEIILSTSQPTYLVTAKPSHVHVSHSCSMERVSPLTHQCLVSSTPCFLPFLVRERKPGIMPFLLTFL